MDLAQHVEQIYRKYHSPSYFGSDPIEFCHRYSSDLDREAVGLVSALLAYGNVTQIRRSISTLLEHIDAEAGSPSQYVRLLARDSEFRSQLKKLRGFKHRFNVGRDIVVLLRLLCDTWEEYGSLGDYFERHTETGAPDFGDALSRLSKEWKASALKHAGPDKTLPSSMAHLINSPKDGSCCKRWCMFLRWMVRRDKVDLGIWSKSLRTDQLVYPVDTHIGQFARKHRITDRKTMNWKAAIEITNYFKKIDPKDPLRFDFAIARTGILKTEKGTATA